MKKRFTTLVDATSTPLASIFGSGFLVIVPILSGAILAVVVLMELFRDAYLMPYIISDNLTWSYPIILLLGGAVAILRNLGRRTGATESQQDAPQVLSRGRGRPSETP